MLRRRKVERDWDNEDTEKIFDSPDIDFDDESRYVEVPDRYEFGIFNADKKKICSANGVDPNSEEWSFIWNEPFGYEFNEYEAKKRVNQINNERAENGTLKTHGRVKYMKRVVQFGDWADV